MIKSLLCGLGNRCSIQLSYGDLISNTFLLVLAISFHFNLFILFHRITGGKLGEDYSLARIYPGAPGSYLSVSLSQKFTVLEQTPLTVQRGNHGTY